MNILIFGPNGSGKGTQEAIIQKKFGVAHVESGAIFRKEGRSIGMARELAGKLTLVPSGYIILLS